MPAAVTRRTRLDDHDRLMLEALGDHLSQAIGKGTPAEAQAMYDELLDLIYRHLR